MKALVMMFSLMIFTSTSYAYDIDLDGSNISANAIEALRAELTRQCPLFQNQIQNLKLMSYQNLSIQVSPDSFDQIWNLDFSARYHSDNIIKTFKLTAQVTEGTNNEVKVSCP